MQDCDEVIEYLYIGNRKTVETNANQFDFIVNCTPDIQYNHNNYIRISIKDDPTECNKLLELIKQTNVLEKIHEHITTNKKVLVHCGSGMQRSCTVVACYLIKYYKLLPEDAIEYIKNKRRIAFFGQVNFLSTINMFYNCIIHNGKYK